MAHTFEPAERTAEDESKEDVKPTLTLRLCKNSNCKNNECILIHDKEHLEVMKNSEDFGWMELVQTTAVRALAKISHYGKLLKHQEAQMWHLQQENMRLKQSFTNPGKGFGKGFGSHTRAESSGATHRAPSATRRR